MLRRLAVFLVLSSLLSVSLPEDGCCEEAAEKAALECCCQPAASVCEPEPADSSPAPHPARAEALLRGTVLAREPFHPPRAAA